MVGNPASKTLGQLLIRVVMELDYPACRTATTTA